MQYSGNCLRGEALRCDGQSEGSWGDVVERKLPILTGKSLLAGRLFLAGKYHSGANQYGSGRNCDRPTYASRGSRFGRLLRGFRSVLCARLGGGHFQLFRELLTESSTAAKKCGQAGYRQAHKCNRASEASARNFPPRLRFRHGHGHHIKESTCSHKGCLAPVAAIWFCGTWHAAGSDSCTRRRAARSRGSRPVANSDR